MLVVVPHAHRYWVESGGRWEFFWISMHGAEALRIHREVLAAAGPVFKVKTETIETLGELHSSAGDGQRGVAGARLGDRLRGVDGAL